MPKKVHDRVQSFVLLSTLCMSYVTKTFLLASSSVKSKQQLCFVHGQGQKKRTETELCRVSLPFPSTNYVLCQ